MNKNLITLEFDKVLLMLSEEVEDKETKEAIMSIRPQHEIYTVNQMLKETYDAHMLSGRFGSPSFYGIKNIISSVSRAGSGGVLSTVELLNILSVIRTMRNIKEWRNHSNSISTSIDGMFDKITINKYLEDRIASSIISEEEISDTASPQLNNIRRKIRSCNSRVRERLDNMIHSSKFQKYLQDPIVTIRNERFVIPVKSEFRNEIKGLVHDASSSGATLFIEPMGVLEDNNRIRELKSEENQEIDKILKSLSSEVLKFSEDILEGYNALVLLNVLFAKASMAYKMRASLPLINDEGRINLKKVRHPLISSDKVVPMDIELGINFDTLVITGPNTGGKTVSIKIIGLLTVMAMSGMMIPVQDNSDISVFNDILVDIGDEQSIEQSLSTFSSHIKNIIKIISGAGNKSLVLLDEVGAGTDPIEGAALAESILEELRSRGAKVAATTHYKELKEYGLRTEGVENACCEFDVETMKPTYRLLIGIPGSSNAFLIAEKLGMSKEIINNAKILTNGNSQSVDKVISGLEKSRLRLEKEREEVQSLYIKYTQMKEDLDRKFSELNNNEEKIVEEARNRAKHILDSVKRTSYNVMEEIESMRKRGKILSAEERAKLNKEIKSMEDMADPIRNHEPEKESENQFKIGDRVIILPIGVDAVVLSNEDKSGNILVQAGIMKSKIKKSLLRLIKGGQTKSKIKGGVTRNIKSRLNMNISTDIDLRGMSSLDAIAELDAFIDSCVMAGIQQVTIIHGKGTGVLRREISSHLKKHKSVLSFRLGTFGEGESGVTIAELG